MTDFRPFPLLGNPHLQTLLGTWLHGGRDRLPSRARRLQLPDGDRMVLHDSILPSWRPEQGIALLVHGMGGCYRSGYMVRLARLLLHQGMRVVRIDLRGSGRGLRLARRSYNAGCSDDVRAVVAEARRWSPTSAIVLVGFSLGGNVVLKLAGETRDQPAAGLTRVAALAPPIDLELCSDRISLRSNRLYERYFLQELLAMVRRKQRCFPDLPAVQFPRRLTLRLFDELYTAPLSGYGGAADYYQRASARPFLSRIETPTLILSARDDPFIPAECFEDLSVPANVEVRLVNHGGHLGFLGSDGAGGIRWAERHVAEWLLRP